MDGLRCAGWGGGLKCAEGGLKRAEGGLKRAEGVDWCGSKRKVSEEYALWQW